MKTALLFDATGRCIGRESRSTDQWDAGALAENMKFIGDNEAWKYKNLNEWYFADGQITKRVLVDMPKPTRQRIRGQPAIHWLRVDQGVGEEWKPLTVYAAGDAITEGFITRASGMSGRSRPDFDSASLGLWDYSEPVIWGRRDLPANDVPPWQPLSAYLAGEKIAVDGMVWVVIRAGVSGATAPEFVGEDNVEDVDFIWIPIPDIPPPIYMMVGTNRVLATAPIKIKGVAPTRVTVALDSPGYYSEPYVIAVEGPANAG